MKVAYVLTTERGGPVWHVHDLATRVAERGHHVTVVCATDRVASIFLGAGIRTHVVAIASKWHVTVLPRLSRLLRGADVVHTQDRRAGLFALPLTKARGAAAVHTYHGLPVDIAHLVPLGGPSLSRVLSDAGVPRLRRLWLERGQFPIEAALARLGPVIVPSRAMARSLVGAGLPADQIVAITPGIVPRRNRPGPLHTPPVVATAAVLEPSKAVDVLVRAVAKMSVPVTLRVYGDGTLRAELERLSSSLRVDATFFGYRYDVREQLHDVDAFALPSRAEQLPVAILEALAWGLPIAATRVGGVPEQVDDGENGFLVAPGDIDGMTRAIERLVTDPEQHLRFGQRSAAIAVERFDMDRAADQTIALYARLMSR